jgi:flavin-dependent dehydrogenase
MQSLYGRMLDEAFHAGAEFRGGTSFTGLDFGATDVRVRLRCAAGEEKIAARFVVGADGASSRVAAALGLDPPQSFLVGVEEVFRDRRPDAIPQLRCFLDQTLAPGYIAWIADDGEEIHAGAAGTEGQFCGSIALVRLRKLVREHIGISDRPPDEIRGGLIPVCGILPEIATTRGLLVGDAAGAVSPLTAGGLDAAIRLAAFAAQTIDSVLSHGGDPSRLYSGERFRARFLSRLWMRRLYAATAGRASSESVVDLLRSPRLRFIGEKIFFGHGSFPIAGAELALPFRDVAAAVST